MAKVQIKSEKLTPFGEIFSTCTVEKAHPMKYLPLFYVF